MLLTRLALLMPPTLMLVACGIEEGEAGERRKSGSLPYSFELAMAGTTDTAADNAAVPAPDQPGLLISLTPEELAAKLATGNIRLIDVRTDAEVAEGAIPGAEHIPLDRFDPARLSPAGGREVVLYCRSGRRSAVAAGRLADATGEPATHLEGGILAWEAAGKSVEKQP